MRARIAVWGSAAGCLALFLASMRFGPVEIDWETIWNVVWIELGLRSEAETDIPLGVRTIVWHVRLPRVLVAGLVGAALSLSGAVLQGIFRNPMASPGVIGVSSGAAVGASVAISLGLAAASIWSVPLLAFGGGLTTAFLVYGLATRDGRTPIATLILCGIAVNAVASSLTSFLLSLQTDDWEAGRQILFWLMGGFNNRSWDHVAIVAPTVAVCTVGAAAFSRELNLMLLGEESATALGVDTHRVKRALLAIAAASAGSAVAVAGVIGFVGLVVPHVVRLLVGPDHRRLLGASLTTGALFLMAMDLISRLLPGGAEIRVGIVTSGLGGPFFLYLVMRHRRRAELF